ncbi:MAG: phosphoribosylformimino-5-aminoimidazole carboxamide ribotide isomerase [Ruminococcus sp.]|nr:phosphoribosylformimino-5-aminoimidazole carboxamide ribotide isomerase [Ruminococcus sp.]
MKFRPCIDIHNGCVKQIVGGSLRDNRNTAIDNFVSEMNGDFYAKLYKKHNLTGGHIIILNPEGSEFYKADVNQAKLALEAFEGGLQVGGGINPHNAKTFLDIGASHVIVTSFVFKNGIFNEENLKKMLETVGKDKLVLDLSCRKRDGKYYIVTDRWQNFTDVELCEKTIDALSKSCDEFLIHAVDVEGKASGVEEEICEMMGDFCEIPSTYAGGISSLSDIEIIRQKGKGKIDFTVGSALDLFGGKIPFDSLLNI